MNPPPFRVAANKPEPTGRLAQYIAQEIARRLALDVDQIGLVGVATLPEVQPALIADGSGDLRRDDNRRMVNVLYAWPRRAGESAPVYGQFTPDGSQR